MTYRTAHRMFHGTRFQGILDKIEECMVAGNKKDLPVLYAELPTRNDMMVELEKGLRGTTTFKNMRNVAKGKGNKWTQVKALASLLSRLAVECEHGRDEYISIVADTIRMMDNLDAIKEARRR